MLDTLPDRIINKIIVNQVTGCWEWIGERNPGGYGRTRWHGPKVVSHRVVYTIMRGEIPDGLTLDHLCRNRPCCNPTHLEPVTPQENTLRGCGLAAQQSKRTHCPRNHPYSGDNLIVRSGRRFCRTCARERNRRA